MLSPHLCIPYDARHLFATSTFWHSKSSEVPAIISNRYCHCQPVAYATWRLLWKARVGATHNGAMHGWDGHAQHQIQAHQLDPLSSGSQSACCTHVPSRGICHVKPSFFPPTHCPHCPQHFFCGSEQSGLRRCFHPHHWGQVTPLHRCFCGMSQASAKEMVPVSSSAWVYLRATTGNPPNPVSSESRVP